MLCMKYIYRVLYGYERIDLYMYQSGFYFIAAIIVHVGHQWPSSSPSHRLSTVMLATLPKTTGMKNVT